MRFLPHQLALALALAIAAAGCGEGRWEPSTVPPAVTITEPAPGAKVPGALFVVKADASDDCPPVKRAKVSVPSRSISAEATMPPFEWKLENIAPGKGLEIVVEAWDGKDQVTKKTVMVEITGSGGAGGGNGGGVGGGGGSGGGGNGGGNGAGPNKGVTGGCAVGAGGGSLASVLVLALAALGLGLRRRAIGVLAVGATLALSAGGCSQPGGAGGGDAGGGGGSNGADVANDESAQEHPPVDTGSAEGAPDRSSASCPVGNLLKETVMVDGKAARYAMHVPPSYDPGKPAPLVMALHGSGSSIDLMPYLSRLMPAAAGAGFIGVAPLGCGDSSGYGWCYGGGGDPQNDVKFLDTLVPHLAERCNINLKKVYLVGFSAGGWFTVNYGFPRSTKITALGVIAAGYKGNEPKSGAGRKIPVFIRSAMGDPNAGAARSLVDRLRTLGWPDADVNAEIEKVAGGHTWLKEWTQPMWDFFDKYELP